MTAEAIWEGVDRLIDGARSPHDLRAHGLHLLAAQRWREQGRTVPASLVESERDASMLSLAAPLVLGEVRADCDGPMLLVKGPEIAARYPDPALRPFGDLDLIVEDADRVHSALLGAGFTPAGAVPREGFHHRQGLRSPRFPLRVEVHDRPGWLPKRDAPPLDELLEAATPARTQVAGILAPSAAHHAVLVAVHAWVHEPLGRISQLVDAMLLLDESGPDEAASVAAAWGVARLWQTTVEAAEAILFQRPERLALRPAIRKLRQVEERTVLESHVYRAVAPFWALPLPTAIRTAAAMFGEAVRPTPGETWSEKRSRAWRAVRHARMGRSQHERSIGFRR
jgi:hypothetical protein